MGEIWDGGIGTRGIWDEGNLGKGETVGRGLWEEKRTLRSYGTLVGKLVLFLPIFNP